MQRGGVFDYEETVKDLGLHNVSKKNVIDIDKVLQTTIKLFIQEDILRYEDILHGGILHQFIIAIATTIGTVQTTVVLKCCPAGDP